MRSGESIGWSIAMRYSLRADLFEHSPFAGNDIAHGWALGNIVSDKFKFKVGLPLLRRDTWK